MKHMRHGGALLLAAGLSACDVPTSMPRWDTTWIVPGEETTVSVVELLPAGLSVNADTSAFVLTIEPVAEDWTLAAMCDLCPPATIVAPKPAFTATQSTTTPLAASVESVDVESGTFDITLTNGFSFDPLRPGVASDSGSITVTMTSGATTVGTVVIDGREQAFAPGTTLDLALQFIPSTITGDVDIEVTLESPAGDPATLDPNDALSFTLSSDGILVSQATVSLAAQPIEGAQSELDLSDVDIESIKDGTIFLDIENPFGVTGQLTITVDPEDGPAIVKPVALAAGNTTAQVHFSEDEMAQLVGSVSELTIAGTVNGGSIVVQPDMAITVGTRLRVTIEVGGSDDENDD